MSEFGSPPLSPLTNRRGLDHGRRAASPAINSPLLTPTIELVAASQTTKGELSVLFGLSWQVALTILFRMGMQMTDLAFLGHLGTDYLAAASLALVWMMITQVFVQRGFGTSMKTLCVQAYGAGNKQLVGVWVQIGVVLLYVCSVPIAVCWYFTGDVISLAGRSAHITNLAGQFGRWATLWLIPVNAYYVLTSYMQSIHVTAPSLIVSAVFALVNIALNLVLIHGVGSWEGLGFIGSPIATALSRTGQVLSLYIYVCVHRRLHTETWLPWSLKSITRSRMRNFLKLAFPNMLSGALEEWQLQLIAFFAAKLGTVEVATHNAVINVFFLVTSVMYGISTGANIRISYYLGANMPQTAKRVAGLSLTYMALPVGIVVGASFVIFRDDVGKIFSSDPEVWRVSARISWLVGTGYAMLSVFYTAMTILDAQGRPLPVALSFLIGAWFVTIPCAYVFAFTLNQGLVGIWYGLIAGYGVITVMSGIIAWRSDWDKAAADAMSRSERSTQKYSEETDAILSNQPAATSYRAVDVDTSNELDRPDID